MEIFVGRDGGVKHIYVDEFSTAFLGERVIRRASHVEPINPVLRVLFHIIRAVVPETGFVAKWTRKWPCRWQANLHLSGGPVLGPFKYRSDAITAEIQWLTNVYSGVKNE